MLSLVAPNDPVKGKWSFTHLPVIPPEFELGPTDKKSAERLKLLVRLAKRKDVDAIINACDAGREGELIFRYIIQYAGVKKPIQRLWLQSMTQAAIREAFANLRDDVQLAAGSGARSRAEADWLVGINGTRAMTAFTARTAASSRPRSAGRPHAGHRGRARNASAPSCRATTGRCAPSSGRRRPVRRPLDRPGLQEGRARPGKRESRLWSQAAAQSVVAACREQPGSVTEESKPSTQMSPALYDLTSLQREANGRFGSAKTTLALAQTLYERHKALTYPRTDSRYLPEDYLNTVKETMRALAQGGSNAVGGLARHAGTVVGEGWVKPNRRIFDNKKVSDHFAIIPTLQIPHDLSEAEGKLYDLVLKRFLAVFFPAAEYRVTTRMTEVQGHRFRTDGKVLVAPGWLAVYGKEAQGEDANLVPVADGETVRTEDVEAVGLTTAAGAPTKPRCRPWKARASWSTTKSCAKPCPSAPNARGHHRRPAQRTCAAKAATWCPPPARQLMTLLSGLDVTELTSPELTGEWEHKLKQIEQGGLGREAFMREIAQMTQVIVKRAKEYERDTVPGDYATLRTPCPKCGAVVKENYRRFACTSCDFRSASTRADAPSNCRKSRNCWPSARSARCKASSARWPALRRHPAHQRRVQAGIRLRPERRGRRRSVDFSGHTPVGACPARRACSSTA